MNTTRQPCTQPGRMLAMAAASALVLAAGVAHSAPLPPSTSLTLSADRALRFGTMVVPDTGSRTVHASGEISDDGVVSLGYGNTGPAEFTLSYDRGSDDPRPVTITFQVILADLPSAQQAGISGQLSQFESDLPGGERLEPGHPVIVTLRDCATRVCTLSFHVGARISVTRSAGGGALTLSPPIIATVVNVE